jgi:hypothetical protein
VDLGNGVIASRTAEVVPDEICLTEFTCGARAESDRHGCILMAGLGRTPFEGVVS